MTDRELLQRALNVLTGCEISDKCEAAITAIRARLAQPEQEQIGCGRVFTENKWTFVCGRTEMGESNNICPECYAANNKDNVIQELRGRIGAMKEILMRKQEPVAWWNGIKEIPSRSGPWPSFNVVPDEYLTIPLYAAQQPAQKPLTDEEWFQWWRVATVLDNLEVEVDYADFMLIVRAIESAHGIKGDA